MAIDWNERTMSTGVERLDQEHQTLIRELNGLMDGIRSGQGHEKIKSTMAWLAEYAGRHFAFEEGCMNAAQCPAAATNRQAHAEFMQALGIFGERLEAEGATPGLGLALERFLSGWMVQHICGVDTQLRKCVGGRSRE